MPGSPAWPTGGIEDQPTIVSDTATYIVAIVLPGATTGRINVTTPAGMAAKNGWFVVT